MNERIRELADEAAKFSAIMTLPTGEAGDNLFVGKFAELIVRECLSYAKDGDIDFMKFMIKQHFGVE